MPFKIDILFLGRKKWNTLHPVFAYREHAREYASLKEDAWADVEDARVVESQDTPTHVMVGGVAHGIHGKTETDETIEQFASSVLEEFPEDASESTGESN